MQNVSTKTLRIHASLKPTSRTLSSHTLAPPHACTPRVFQEQRGGIAEELDADAAAEPVQAEMQIRDSFGETDGSTQPPVGGTQAIEACEAPTPTPTPNVGDGSEDGPAYFQQFVGRFVIPSRSAGLLIGQGGDTVNKLNEISGARIQLFARNGHNEANRSGSSSSINGTGQGSGTVQHGIEAPSSSVALVHDFIKERIVNVSGSPEACIKAMELSLEKLVEEDMVDNPEGE